MDFYDIFVKKNTSNRREYDYQVRPEFMYTNSDDIVCKGGGFYAFYHEDKWHDSLTDFIALVDRDVMDVSKEIKDREPDATVKSDRMVRHSTKLMDEFMKFTKNMPQSEVTFDSRIFFSDEQPKKTDYSTGTLNYYPAEGESPAFDELALTLYDKDELDKILWCVGALLSNEMDKIQKFLYLFGSKGSGKGTMINIIKLLLGDYWGVISLKTLTGDSEFATATIIEKPCLIDDDTDMSRITNDTWLLKLTAHEPIAVNMKYKTPYNVTFKGLLIAASNQEFQVRNVDSGITRRGIVARPTNVKVEQARYRELMGLIRFELPQIAHKAISTFKRLGPYFYDDYVDVEMVSNTDHIFDFMREYYDQLGDPCSLRKASELYKLYLEDIGYGLQGYKRKIKKELNRYYQEFHERYTHEGEKYKNVYTGLRMDQVFPEHQDFENVAPIVSQEWLYLSEIGSQFDTVAKTYPAQLANADGFPRKAWDNNTQVLADIPTDELHYVRIPLNHIVIDFDLKNSKGEKDLVLNLEAARKFPPTYAELSKSGQGLHLHYIYEGDPTMLESLYDDDIEIKVFTGKQALRRKLTKCNNLEIAKIISGLPMKEEEINVYSDVSIITWNEKKMRTAVKRNMLKQYHPNTKPSVDFIVHIFEEAEKNGVKYDLSDMRGAIVQFAMSSSNSSEYCLKAIQKIKYSTIEDDSDIQTELQSNARIIPDEELYFYDIEVFPNLFIVSYKRYGDDQVYSLINPTPNEIERLLEKPLVGFNNRRYDNHILYAAALGEDNMKLYQQSQRIISGQGRSGFYGGAYELSYADIYDYSVDKKSLKKWEIELDLEHIENELPWDQPVPEDRWEEVAKYCENDVLATEAVFKHIYADYTARVILSELSGLSVNATNNQHSAKIIFGDDRNPQNNLNYTDLSEMFPGYKYEYGKSIYRGEDPSEGGYVYSEPGVYRNVALIDVVSMHPNSALNMNYFGPYQQKYQDLVDIRVLIKHKEYDKVRSMMGGKLARYLQDDKQAKQLSGALKIPINSVYGMSSAKFDNAFKHPMNVDNIIAKRGALFMIDLKYAVQEQGYKVIHIKTDSIKIADADQKIIDFVFEFGKKYSYEFEHEATYEKFAIVNKAVYIAYDQDGWHATGKQFAEPYVYKTLFTKEPITNNDYSVVVQSRVGSLYLGDAFIGRIGKFYPSVVGRTLMVRQETEDGIKEGAPAGTKSYKWRTWSEYKGHKDVDMSYFNKLVHEAYDAIASVGDASIIFDTPPLTA